MTAGHHFATTALERVVARRDPTFTTKARSAVDRSFREARAAFAESLRDDLPFPAVVARAGLSVVEAELLALAVGVERDERLAKLVVHLTGDRDRWRLELSLVPELLDTDERTWALLGPDGRLASTAFVSVDIATGFARAAVRVAPRLLWALAGDRSADPALPVAAELVTEPADGTRDATHPDGEETWPAVLVTGPDRTRRRHAAGRATGGVSLVTPAPSDDAGWAALVLEATLARATAVVELDGPLPADGRRWIERATHLRWALSSKTPIEVEHLPRLGWREIDADGAGPSDAEWAAALGEGRPRTHRLSADQLRLVGTALAARGGDLDAAVRRLVSPKLDTLARHIRPRHSWGDLVLPPEHAAQLRDLVDRYRLGDQVYGEWGFPAVPSRGLVALFSGPSGTGKTLAAEIVAGELGLDLYKLDLSAIVSKWVGETEKNLDELFEAAGAGNLVLFFDEADALFGKRSDVADSHDRYANLETSYLLQRLETYDGVVVMATNYEKNIDQAFMRRIHVRVDFALPDERERRAIWRRHLQARAEVASDVDVDWLAARFEIPGAAIRNAVVDGAFLTAAGDGEAIDMASLVRGVARELRKLGRLVRREDFDAWYPAVVGEHDVGTS